MRSWRIGSPAARRVAAALGAGAATAVLAWAPPASASAAHGVTANAVVEPGAVYEIVALAGTTNGSKCVDVPNGSTSPGTQLQIFHCHGFDRNGGPQLFSFIDMGNGYYQVINQHSNLCFELPNSSGADGTPIEQASCFGFDTMQWQFQFQFNATGTGPVYGLVNKAFPNMCLAWQGSQFGPPADGNKLVMTTCRLQGLSSDGKQLWWLG